MQIPSLLSPSNLGVYLTASINSFFLDIQGLCSLDVPRKKDKTPLPARLPVEIPHKLFMKNSTHVKISGTNLHQGEILVTWIKHEGTGHRAQGTELVLKTSLQTYLHAVHVLHSPYLYNKWLCAFLKLTITKINFICYYAKKMKVSSCQACTVGDWLQCDKVGNLPWEYASSSVCQDFSIWQPYRQTLHQVDYMFLITLSNVMKKP